MKDRVHALKARWAKAYLDSLPDSAFLFVEEGEKDDEGRTVPRSKRHLPVRDSAGEVNAAHVRNALQRLPQMDNYPGLDRAAVKAYAETLLTQANETGQKSLSGTGNGLERGLKVFEGPDGRPWLLTWTTNSFEDREAEIFTQKSIEEYVERNKERETKGEYWLWHIPGARFGEIRWQGVSGRFLVEAGPFDNTFFGRKCADFLAQYPDGHPEIAPGGWGCSHGYVYKAKDRADGVYEWFEKEETSVLPLRSAANPYTAMEVFQMALSQKQIEALKAIGGARGDELVQEIIERGDRLTKTLEAQGVACKSAGEAEAADAAKAAPAAEAAPEVSVQEAEPVDGASAQPAPEAVDAPVAGVDVKGIAEQVAQMIGAAEIADGLKKITDVLAQVAEKVNAQDAEIKALAGEQERARKDAQEQSRVPWMMLRPSEAESTEITKAQGEKAGRPLPAAVQNIATRMATGQ